MTTQAKKDVYTVSEVADRLGISKNLAYTLARRKELPGVIHLGKWRMMVSVAAIEKLLDGNHNE